MRREEGGSRWKGSKGASGEEGGRGNEGRGGDRREVTKYWVIFVWAN